MFNKKLSLSNLRLKTGDIIIFRIQLTWFEWLKAFFHEPITRIGMVIEDPPGQKPGLYIMTCPYTPNTSKTFYVEVKPIYADMFYFNTISVRLLHLSDGKKENLKRLHEICMIFRDKDKSIEYTDRHIGPLKRNIFGGGPPKDWNACFIASLFSELDILRGRKIRDFTLEHFATSINQFTRTTTNQIELKFANLSNEIAVGQKRFHV